MDGEMYFPRTFSEGSLRSFWRLLFIDMVLVLDGLTFYLVVFYFSILTFPKFRTLEKFNVKNYQLRITFLVVDFPAFFTIIT